MEARLVHHLRRDQAEPAHDLDADRDAFERGLAAKAVSLADRQHRRNDHRAGMHRPALERVVEILAMRRGAVAEGRARGAQCTFMADCGAGSVFVPARQRAADIVLVARGDAETDDVDQRFLAFRSRGGRERSGVDGHDTLSELFGNGNVGKFCVHRQIPSTMNTAPVIPG